jgi:lactate dehydrogenase-like 2-hydroxyacid dehydrogenase
MAEKNNFKPVASADRHDLGNCKVPIYGKKIGIAGFGSIGRAAAEREFGNARANAH